MLTIRLMRFGRKHQPFFRLVVVPKRGKHDRAKYVESVGWVDPLQHKHSVNAERVKYWMSVGAQPSDTAWNLFVKEGIIADKKRPVHTRAVSEVKGEKLAQVSVAEPTVENAVSEAEEATVEANEVPTEEAKEEVAEVVVDTETKE